MTVNLDEEVRKMAKTKYEKEQGIEEEPTFFGEDIPRNKMKIFLLFLENNYPKDMH